MIKTWNPNLFQVWCLKRSPTPPSGRSGDIPRSDASRKCSDILGFLDTFDGRNLVNQLRLVVHPIMYKVLYIPGGAGSFPSTVRWGLWFFALNIMGFKTDFWPKNACSLLNTKGQSLPTHQNSITNQFEEFLNVSTGSVGLRSACILHTGNLFVLPTPKSSRYLFLFFSIFSYKMHVFFSWANTWLVELWNIWAFEGWG